MQLRLPARERGASLLVVSILIVLVILLIAGLIGAYKYWQLAKAVANKGVNSQVVYVGRLETPRPFPTTISGATTVTYKVTAYQGSQNNLGPVLTGGLGQAQQGVDVTFMLVRGDASVNNAAEVTVQTNQNGVATATIAAVRTGSDTLSIKIGVGGHEVADNETFDFEVVKQ